MELIVGALAVYKIVHVVDLLTPKEAMPWVKVLFSLAISIPTAFFLGLEYPVVSGCAIATLAGTVHAVLRLIVLVGDSTQRKVIR